MNKEQLELMVKCIKFYISHLTANGEQCPSVDDMREIVQLDDISKGLEKKAAAKTDD